MTFAIHWKMKRKWHAVIKLCIRYSDLWSSKKKEIKLLFLKMYSIPLSSRYDAGSTQSIIKQQCNVSSFQCYCRCQKQHLKLLLKKKKSNMQGEIFKTNFNRPLRWFVHKLKLQCKTTKFLALVLQNGYIGLVLKDKMSDRDIHNYDFIISHH